MTALLHSLLFTLALLQPQAQGGGGFLGVILADAARPTVSELVPDSPAAKAGLRVGDRFLAVDGVKVDSPESFAEAVRKRSPGEKVRFALLRGEQETELTITLGKYFERAAEGPARGEPRQERAPAAEAQRGAKPFLGLALAEADAGLRVDEVLPRSPAQAAGVQVGDVLLTVGGTKVRTLDGLDKVVGTLTPGARVGLVVRRGDAMQDLELTVGSAPAPRPAAEMQPRSEERARPVPERTQEPIARAPIAWFEGGLPRAVAAARDRNQHVVAVFGADWCSACQALKRSFQDPKVRDALEGFVPVWIDTDKEGRMAEEWHVGEIPHLVILRGDGKARATKVGYLPPPALVELLQANRPQQRERARVPAQPQQRGDRSVARVQPPPQPRPMTGPEAAETEALRAEVRALRDELRALREEVRALLEARRREERGGR